MAAPNYAVTLPAAPSMCANIVDARSLVAVPTEGKRIG